MALDPTITDALVSAAAAWAWNGIGKKVADKLGDEATEQIEQFGWDDAAEAYAQGLHREVSTMRIFGASGEVPLDDVFTDVNILDDVVARRRHDIRRLREQEFDRFDASPLRGRIRRVDGLDLVKEGRNLFILGQPGAGKTTFLKYVATQALLGEIERTPIFVSLKEWSTSGHARLEPFIAERFTVCNFPNAEDFIAALLRDGKALVLFDGLDEVNLEGNRRSRLVSLLNNFAQQYAASHCLITCRIAASDYAFRGFRDVEIAPFDRDQIHDYSRKWFGRGETGEREAGEKQHEAFIAGLYEEQNAGVRDLCSQPLLLSMVCLAYEKGGGFPANRLELYEDALNALLVRWDSSRNIRRDRLLPEEALYRDLTWRQKARLFAEIGAPAFEKGEFYFERRRLCRAIETFLARMPGAKGEVDGDTVLRAIVAQHGIFAERAKDIFAFSHLTFQEYFTARYIADNEARGATRRMMAHLSDRRWREVFLLTAGQLEDDFIAELRTAVDGLVGEDETLVELLRWADTRSSAAGVEADEPPALRLAYIGLATALDRDFAIALDRAFDLTRDLARDRELAIALDRALDLAHDLANALASDRDLDLAIAIARNRVFVHYRDLALAYGDFVGFDYALYFASAFAATFSLVDDQRRTEYFQTYADSFSGMREMARPLEDAQLNRALADLDAPSADASQEAWRVYEDTLFAILRDQRDLGREWDFSDAQWERFSDYLAANELLVRCLELAYVRDRQAILDNLLAPPGG